MEKNFVVQIFKNHSIHVFRKDVVMAFFKKIDIFKKIAEQELKNIVKEVFEPKKENLEDIKTSLELHIVGVILSHLD